MLKSFAVLLGSVVVGIGAALALTLSHGETFSGARGQQASLLPPDTAVTRVLPLSVAAPTLPRPRPKPQAEAQPEPPAHPLAHPLAQPLARPQREAAPPGLAAIALAPTAPRLTISSQSAAPDVLPQIEQAAPSAHIPNTPGAINFTPWTTGIYR